METYSFENRHEIVNELQNYLKDCQNEVSSILETVGWTPEHFLKQDDIVSCSFDSSHRMPRHCLEKHEEKCELLFVGYRKEDLPDVMHDSKISENIPMDTKVHLDKDTLNRVLRDHHVKNQSLFYAQDRLPLTPEEFRMQLTPAERASVYNYAIEKARERLKSTDPGNDKLLSADLQEFVLKKENANRDKPKSYMEYLKAERDYKRRRQSYRAKNVHITRKSYTEIIREVIQNQTEYLSDILQDEADHSEKATVTEEIPQEIRHEQEEKEEYSDDNRSRGRDKSKKKKKHKKHKHKHKHRSDSRSESRSHSRSRSRSRT